jgi:hypothetical protein
MTSQKKPTTVDLDPWEDGYEDGDSDLVGGEGSAGETVESTGSEIALADDFSDDELNASEVSEDEWVVKYPPSKYPLRPRDLEARDKRRRALQYLAVTGSPKKAARAVGLTPRALFLARERIPDFDRNWKMAIEIYKEFEADEQIRKRAIDGNKVAVWYQGEIVGYEIKYDSGLTQFWAKSNMRDKYGDKSEVTVNGPGHGIALLPATIINLADWEAMAAKVHADHKIIDITPEKVEDSAKPKTIGRK